jgi:hypothetical protein
MYWVMLLLTLGPTPVSIAACRFAMSAAYIWSGIQKFNPRYFQEVPHWFVAPAAGWPLPSTVIDLLRGSVVAAPFLELSIGLALWIAPLRWVAMGAVLAIHLGALVFLGPLGHKYNWVVWPWNLAMIGLVWALFANGRWGRQRKVQSLTPQLSNKPGRSKLERGLSTGAGLFNQTLTDLKRSKAVLLATALYSLLPILSFFGRWDSDFSFALYSENQAVANIFVTEAFGDRLPAHMRPYVKPFAQVFDPERQAPFTFAFQAWCYEELGVPPIPEPRNFRFVFNFLRSYSRDPADLRMIVGQRAGPVVFYQGDRREFLTPAGR